jgi:hypothetical protein
MMSPLGLMASMRPALAPTVRRGWRRGALAAVMAAGLLCGCTAGASDNDPSCSTSVTFAEQAVVGVPVHGSVIAQNYPGGVPAASWTISRGGAEVARGATDAIEFLPSVAGIYDVSASVASCHDYAAPLNVSAAGAMVRRFRVRLTPPAGTPAAPQEKALNVLGGSDRYYGSLLLAPSVSVTGTLRGAASAAGAYLRFSAPGTSAAPVEAVTGPNGKFTARVSQDPQDVLIVPAESVAPLLLRNWSAASPDLVVPDAGLQATGVLQGPAGAPLAGAKVALRSDGVPSTVATTAADGTFTLRLRPGALTDLTVTPPAGSGLPRLVASAQAIDTTKALTIRYAAGLAVRDLGGVLLRRQAAPAPAATAIFVAQLASAATVTAGSAAALPLGGVVRVAAVAGSDGRIPATLVPQVPLSAVLVTAPGELTVLPFDASATTPPAVLASATMPLVTGTVRAGSDAAAGAVVTLRPTAALALADVPAVTTTSGAAGEFSVAGAAGGVYQAVVSDPRGRGAPVTLAAAPPGPLGAVALAPGFRLSAVLSLEGLGQALPNTAVELLCGGCSGVASQRPLSEAVSDLEGKVVLVMPSAAE